MLIINSNYLRNITLMIVGIELSNDVFHGILGWALKMAHFF